MTSLTRIFQYVFKILVLLTILSPSAWTTPTPTNPSPLLAQVQLTNYELNASQGSELKILLTLPPGYKAYEDQFRLKVISPEGFKIAGLQISPLKEFFDKTTKKIRKVVAAAGVILVPFEAPRDLSAGEHTLELQLTYQVCTESYCLFPQTMDLKAPFIFHSLLAANDSIPETAPAKSLLSLEIAEVFKKGLLWTFLFVFLAGVLTSFTPCIFPMIPITLSVLGKNAHTRSRWQNFMVSGLYVLGIAVTYSIMGVVAASTGALFGSFMSHPIVLSVMSLVFLTMALSMFGLFELEAPAFIQNRFSSSDDLTGYSGAFFSGIISGVVASPCVGPVLVGVLTYIAKSQNLVLGFFLMFTYALGMGQIFLALGMFSQLTKLLPKSGPWLDGVKHFFGVLMTGVFYYFLSLLLPVRAWDITLGFGLAIIAGYFGAFRTVAMPSTKDSIRKSLLLAVTVLGGVFLAIGVFNLRPQLQQRWIQDQPGYDIHATNWVKYSEAELARAQSLGKPVILDFNAEWCAACKELDQFTFTNQRFQLLSTNFVLMKYDATAESAELEQLRAKYEIFGLPTVLFFNGKGELQKDLTLTQFEEADAFIIRMSKAMK